MKQSRPTDEQLAETMRALAHPARISILRFIAAQKSDCYCNDVKGCLSLAQSTVSQHIKVLLQAGLISREQQGTRNRYTVDADRLTALEDAFGTYLGSLNLPLTQGQVVYKESS